MGRKKKMVEGEVAIVELESATIEVPLGATSNADFGVHVDFQLGSKTACKLRRLLNGLDEEKATLESGQRVTELTHAVRWLCEQLP